jgi:hypothetical protein
MPRDRWCWGDPYQLARRNAALTAGDFEPEAPWNANNPPGVRTLMRRLWRLGGHRHVKGRRVPETILSYPGPAEAPLPAPAERGALPTRPLASLPTPAASAALEPSPTSSRSASATSEGIPARATRPLLQSVAEITGNPQPMRLARLHEADSPPSPPQTDCRAACAHGGRPIAERDRRAIAAAVAAGGGN